MCHLLETNAMEALDAAAPIEPNMGRINLESTRSGDVSVKVAI